MNSNQFGKMLTMTTFGESHGNAMGVVIDGLPAGLPINLEHLHKELERRAPGKILGTTTRKEEDMPEILSGIFEGRTLGTPVAVIVRNLNHQSSDYDALKNNYRPGHADQTTIDKFGMRDHRGGGRASGRETVARVIAGYFAGLIIPQIKVQAVVTKLGPFQVSAPEKILARNDLNIYGLPQSVEVDKVQSFLLDCQKDGESVGGKISVRIEGAPAGLGAPVFDKLKADLSKAMLSIGACVGFNYGLGEEFTYREGQKVTTKKENFGGMEGGISNGETINFEVWFRPPSTVGEKARLGRHDPCILPRVIPVVEAMATFVIADHYLRQLMHEHFKKLHF